MAQDPTGNLLRPRVALCLKRFTSSTVGKYSSSKHEPHIKIGAAYSAFIPCVLASLYLVLLPLVPPNFHRCDY